RGAAQRDHGRVVGAERRARDEHVDADRLPELRHALAQTAVGRYAAGDDDALHASRVDRLAGGVDQHVDERLLDAGRDVGQITGGGRVLAHVLPDRRLEPTEAEVEPAALHARARKADRAGVAVAGQAIDHRPAGIAEAEDLRDLVERLADRVVARAAEAR